MRILTVSRRRGVGVTILIASLVLLAAEVGARVIEVQISPADWGSPESDAKVEAMQDFVATMGFANIVFLGSSSVNVGIDPSYFERPSFNAALPGSSPRSLELWAEEVVEPALDPQLIVLGLTSRDLNDNGFSHRDFYSTYINSIGRAEASGSDDVGQQVESWFYDRIGLIRIRGYLRDPVRLLSALRSGAGRPITDEGWAGRAEVYQFDDDYRQSAENRQLNDYEIGGIEVEAILRMIDSAREHGIDVVVVNLPVVRKDHEPMLPSEGPNLYRDQLETISTEYGVRLIDLSDLINDVSGFADPIHLNTAGAKIFSAELALQLEDLVGASG